MLNVNTNIIYRSGLLLIAITLLVACEKKTDVTGLYEKPEAVTSAQKVKSNKREKGSKHPEWMITPETAQTWAEKKVGMGGHTLPGSPSWQKYMNFLEKEFKKAGMVDMFRHSWTFDRWFTSEIPDTSKWSLHINDKPVRVVNYAAYSGSTGSKGITAPLVFYNLKNPPKDIKGKIVVFKTQHSPTSSSMNKTF